VFCRINICTVHRTVELVKTLHWQLLVPIVPVETEGDVMHCSKLMTDKDCSKLTIVTEEHHSTTTLNCYSTAISRQNCCGKLMAKVLDKGGSDSKIL
jgi:hypothetical protein